MTAPVILWRRDADPALGVPPVSSWPSSVKQTTVIGQTEW